MWGSAHWLTQIIVCLSIPCHQDQLVRTSYKTRYCKLLRHQSSFSHCFLISSFKSHLSSLGITLLVFLTFLVIELLILHNLIDVCQMQLQLRKPLCWLNQFSWHFSDLLKSVFHFLLPVFPYLLTFLTYITVLVLLDRCLKFAFIFYALFSLPKAFITHLSLAFLILFF